MTQPSPSIPPHDPRFTGAPAPSTPQPAPSEAQPGTQPQQTFRPERQSSSVQALLLVLGVGLVSAGVFVFASDVYSTLGESARAACIGALGVAGLIVSRLIASRLRITAEGIAWVGLVALTIDAQLIGYLDGPFYSGMRYLATGGVMLLTAAAGLALGALRIGSRPAAPLRAYSLYAAAVTPWALSMALTLPFLPRLQGDLLTGACLSLLAGAVALLPSLRSRSTRPPRIPECLILIGETMVLLTALALGDFDSSLPGRSTAALGVYAMMLVLTALAWTIGDRRAKDAQFLPTTSSAPQYAPSPAAPGYPPTAEQPPIAEQPPRQTFVAAESGGIGAAPVMAGPYVAAPPHTAAATPYAAPASPYAAGSPYAGASPYAATSPGAATSPHVATPPYDAAANPSTSPSATASGVVRWIIGAATGVTAIMMVALTHHDFTEPVSADLICAPFGLMALAVGLWRMRVDPALRSWTALWPAMTFLFAPTLLMTWTADAAATSPRSLALFAAAIVALLAGAAVGWKAPLATGATVLVLHTARLVWPWIAELSRDYWWVWLLAAGIILITAAARYEASLNSMRLLGRRFSQLR